MGFNIEAFLEHGLTEGQKHLRRFVKAMESGQAQSPETIQFIKRHAVAGIHRLAAGSFRLRLDQRFGLSGDADRVLPHRMNR